jgi:hypothetical protein
MSLIMLYCADRELSGVEATAYEPVSLSRFGKRRFPGILPFEMIKTTVTIRLY